MIVNGQLRCSRCGKIVTKYSDENQCLCRKCNIWLENYKLKYTNTSDDKLKAINEIVKDSLVSEEKLSEEDTIKLIMNIKFKDLVREFRLIHNDIVDIRNIIKV